jgi:hypothetical protein
MYEREYDEDQFDTRRIKVREKRARNKQNFRNMDPRQILEDEWDDEYYAIIERFHGKRK